MKLRSKSQKYNGAWKQLLSVLLAFSMIITMMPMTQLSVNAEEIGAAGGTGQVTIKAHFKNTDKWNDVYVYACEGDSWTAIPGYEQYGSWPGAAVSENDEHPGYYTLELTKDSSSRLNYIFNDGSGSQTGDLCIETTQFNGDNFEVWVQWAGEKGNEVVSYTEPSDWGVQVTSPQVSGNEVTFCYGNKKATDVYLAGDMNNWSETENKMTQDEDGIYSCTMTLEPGIYKYQFVVDGTYKQDPNNPAVLENNSVLYMPGLVGGQLSVVKGQETALPEFLTKIEADGTEKQASVVYTLKTQDSEQVSLNMDNNTVTVDESYVGDTVELMAANGMLSTTIALKVVTAEEKVVSPQINGHEVTFCYKGTAASVTGSMNGWKEVEMTESENSGVLTYTMPVSPGNYTYQFVVDGKKIKDPNNLKTSGEGSCLIIPGLVDTKYSAVKGKALRLPSQLTKYEKDGTSAQLDVTYSVKTENAKDFVTIDNTTVNVSEDYTENTVELTATAGDATATVVIRLVEDTNQITLKLHYDRPDNEYTDWNAWMWLDGKDGAAYDFEEEDGEKVATITVDGRANSVVKYIIRKGEWESKDIESDRQMDISDVLSGTVHYYVKSGVKEATRVLGDDVLTGVKVKSAKYDADTNQVVVTTSLPVNADVTGLFAVKHGDQTEIEISDVSAEENTYTLTLKENISGMKDMLKTYILTFDGYDYPISMPSVYSAEEFETEYTYNGNDLGATWSSEKTTFKVWAPTAETVQVKLYESGTKGTDDCIDTLDMQKGEKGVWTAEKTGDLNGKYYTYLVTVDGKTNEACDPYARTTGVNGNRAMILDLDSTDPQGWSQDASPNQGMSYTDSIIYELHVRDLSSDSSSGIKNTGKFLGLTERGTKNATGQATGLDHIIDLGITHLHLLPSYDYGSVDETRLNEAQFNWGYDPVNYNVPEGSYSTDPYNGEVRVKEMKQMVKTLHENNINVVMDVVYNHVYSAESFCFNQIVPQYFSRLNEDGSYSNGSGCGNDTASERSMVKKYIVDSVKYWADEYHIDGFRFDLVGLLDTETVNEIVTEVHKTHPNVLFYGEGWTMVTCVSKEGYTMATQVNSEQTPDFAYFSDTIRDGLKGSVFEAESTGFVSGMKGQEALIAQCFTATTDWCKSPAQTVNYASCHDNYTLKDKLDVSRADATEADRIKMNNLAAAVYMTSQGIPFIHAGEELLRTKVDETGNIEHNSYNSSDYVNAIKWSNLDKEEYRQVRDYYKGLIELRKNHKAFRLQTAEEVDANVDYVQIKNGPMMFVIKGKDSIPGEVADEIVVIFNANTTKKTFRITDYGASMGEWKVCVNDEKAGIEAISTTDGEVTVQPLSAMVLVKGQTEDKDSVYVDNAKVTDVALNKTTTQLKIGSTETLTATVNPKNVKDANVVWKSSDNAVASVDNAGVIKAVKAGTAVITATAGGKSATCTVTVTDPAAAIVLPQTVTLSSTKLTILKGKKASLSAVVAPENATDKKVIWSSSDEKVATVDTDGNITGKMGGTATITAQTANGKTATCEVTVAQVSLNVTKMPLQVGTTTSALKVETKFPSNDKIKSWKSSNKKVATVTKKGKIKGVKTGKATITVTMKSGATATCKVTVQKGKVVTKGLSVSEKKVTLSKGKSIKLTIKRNPISATEKITWSTSNKKVATVNSKGKVTAKKAGTATITAKTSNGKKVTCKVTVKK